MTVSRRWWTLNGLVHYVSHTNQVTHWKIMTGIEFQCFHVYKVCQYVFWNKELGKCPSTYYSQHQGRLKPKTFLVCQPGVCQKFLPCIYFYSEACWIRSKINIWSKFHNIWKVRSLKFWLNIYLVEIISKKSISFIYIDTLVNNFWKEKWYFYF